MNFLSQIQAGTKLSETPAPAPAPPKPKYPVVGAESIMAPKAHGTAERPVQADLRWGCDRGVADRICCFNRHYAEHSGSAAAARDDAPKAARAPLILYAARARFARSYFEKTRFLADVPRDREVTFHDSVSGRPLFTAPRGPGRDFAAFEAESKAHGWPSFRDAEVNWDFVRCLPDGECVSVDGTHLGHNLPDRSGNRCAPPPRSRRASGRARWRALSLRRARARTQIASTSSPSPGTRPRRARPRPARVPRDLAPSRGSPVIWRRARPLVRREF